MAAKGPNQQLCEEATCSICLDFFRDPVTIAECGHNFCRACLIRYWGERGPEASCPQCRGRARKWNLQPNLQLANFVERIKFSPLEGKGAGIKWEVCEKHQEPMDLFCKDDETPLCVVCGRSEEHKDHEIFPLEDVFQENKAGVAAKREGICPKHKEPLTLFCKDDEAPICVVCDRSKEHRSHRTLLLEEASQEYKASMDRFVISKREPPSDAEDSSCTPTPSSSTDLNERPGDSPPCSSRSLAEGEGDCSENTVPGAKQKAGGRQFQKSWKQIYRWLSYNVVKDKAFCDICRSADAMNAPLPNTLRDKEAREAFVQNGFSTWKKALQRFQTHENSSLHRAAVLAVASVKSGVNVRSQPLEGPQKEMQDARKALHKILASVRYLAYHGIAMHGHDDEDSKLRSLMLLHTEDVPELKPWLDRTNFRWVSPTMTNEMLELMAHSVLCRLMKEIKAAVYYSVVVDETTDIATQEQVSVCFRIATEDMSVEEFFFGFYEMESTTAETLFSILKDVLCHFDLPLDRCRGQCYDGAANVAGHVSGVQALVKAEEPRALHVHCLAHVVNLVVRDVSENVDMCRDFLYEFSDLITFVKTSPKRLNQFRHIQQEENVNFKQFCLTRWTVRAASLQSVASNYGELIEYFEIMSSGEQGKSGTQADGYARWLLRFASYFMLQLMLLVFGRLDALNTSLQRNDLQFHQAELLVAKAKGSIDQMRDNFEQFWLQTVKKADDLQLKSPKVPKRTRCVDAGHDPHQFQSPEDFYRKLFYEIIDNISSSLQSRFSSDVSQHMSKIEKFVIGEDDNTYIVNFYGSDLDAFQLQIQRDMFLDLAKRQDKKPSNFSEALELFRGEEGKTCCRLLPELAKLIRISLTIPVSSCTSERSLSCLRRVKTFLRSTMGQAGLNHIALLLGHKQLTMEIDLDVIANEFVQKTEDRVNTFSIS